jgi:ubiquinone/menaquinone biosynthesis C-methylase UbiE
MNIFHRMKTLPAETAYDLWASSYHNESNPVRDLNNRTIASWLPELNGQTVLDIGCGTGYFCELALNKKAKQIYGIDLSNEMVRHASKRLGSRDALVIEKGSAEILNFNNGRFNLVVASLVYGHLRNLVKSFDEAARVLTLNGTFIFSDFHPHEARRGGKRTFKDPKNQQTLAIEHYIHSKKDYVELLLEHGFSIESVAEPEWANKPVVLVIKAKKIK